MEPVGSELETLELRSFVVLAEQRHFGRAAEVLAVSQPALSKRIQRLEEKVGGALLSRGYRDLRLTEAGLVLLERTRTLLRENERALELCRHAVKGEAGRLRIGFGVASIAQLLPDVVLRFRRSHPRVQLEMRDMSSPAQRLALRREEIDLGFVRLPIGDAELQGAAILHERLVAAIGRETAWKDREGLASLAEEPFVVCGRAISASYYDHVIALCRTASFTPRIVTETNELFSLLQLVRAGIGVALVPSGAASMRVPGVRFKPIPLREAAWDIALTWNRHRQRSPLLESFVRVARQIYEERS
jgi:DNA-binding transcriptional LysR family regulator